GGSRPTGTRPARGRRSRMARAGWSGGAARRRTGGTRAWSSAASVAARRVSLHSEYRAGGSTPMPGEDRDGARLPGVLVEGLDYYTEDGRWVFTTRYLRRRGYCCGNGCRHCPYGLSGGPSEAGRSDADTPG